MSRLKFGPDGPMKVCPGGCGRVWIGWTAIRQAFDCDRQRQDGLRTYCKECRQAKRPGVKR